MEDGVQHAGGSTDRVVREIDVCLSNGLLGTNTKVSGCHSMACSIGLGKHEVLAWHVQMYLLQYPLRPPWRPYDLSHCEVVCHSAECFALQCLN